MSEERRMGTVEEEPKVFISYRREDTAAHAGRLYDAMATRLGDRNVFMDVDMQPGVDFVELITRVVSGCVVLIVVMGRNWATVEDDDGGPRLADPNDFVRLELETALRHPQITLIPVLVSGARMPDPEDLPAELRPLTRRNALDLSDGRWSYDVGRLMSALDEFLPDFTRPDRAVPDSARPAPPPAPKGSPARLVLEAIAVAAIAAYVGRWLGELIVIQGEEGAKIAKTILRRADTWALVGASLAAWLAIRVARADPVGAIGKGLVMGALGGAIGGAIWAVPVYLTGGGLLDNDFEATQQIEVGALAVTGAFIGALVGSLWKPPRRGAGLLGGAAGGALLQIAVILTGSNDNPEPPPGETALGFAVAAAVVAGLALAVLLLLDRQGRRDAGGGT